MASTVLSEQQSVGIASAPHKLVVLSICKDEEATIGELLDRVPKQIAGIDEIEVIVISDGSTDRTVEIAREKGATVIDGRTCRRLAFRFQQGVELALEAGATVAVNIDGDLQFRPEDIPKFVKIIRDGQADFVAADRFTDSTNGSARRPENMPIGKYWGNRLGARIVGGLSDEKFTDVTCGFRAYNKSALLALNINSKYTYTQESFQLLAHHGLDITSLPVDVTYYPGRKSRVVTNFWQFLATSSLNILRSFRDFAPLRFFTALAIPPFILGVAWTLFVGQHWARTGRTSPFTSFGLIGIYLLSLGLIVGVVGLLADMLVRSSRNQEKILRELKAARFASHDRERLP